MLDMRKLFYHCWNIICLIGMIIEILWFISGSIITLYLIYNGFVEENLKWLNYIKFYILLVILPIVIYEIIISLLSWFFWNNFFGYLQLPQKKIQRSMIFKNLFSMAKSTNKAVEEDDARWKKELDLEIGKLSKSDVNYKKKVWFYEQFYIFITDRTMAHPNPGVSEDQEYNWTFPVEIEINNDKEWFHASHPEEIQSRLIRYKDLYVQGKMNVYEYCKERESIQKDDDQFRHLFRY